MRSQSIQRGIVAALSAAFVFSGSVAWGQTYATRHTNNGPSVIHRHSSTFEEGIRRGTADVIRAWGDYNYNTSLALINREEARQRYLQNRQLNTETYFRMRQINREAREYERGERVTHEDAVRISQLRAPKGLEANQYEPVLGRLYWPNALLSSKFDGWRAEIDHLVANRLAFPSNSTKVQHLADEMKDILQADIRKMDSRDYIAAKDFLNRLDTEMKSAPIGGVAANP